MGVSNFSRRVHLPKTPIRPCLTICDEAGAETLFADKTLHVVYHNPAKLGYGAYRIGAVQIVGQGGACQKNGRRISRSVASR